MLARQNDGDKYYAIKILDKSKVSTDTLKRFYHIDSPKIVLTQNSRVEFSGKIFGQDFYQIFSGRKAKTDRTHPKWEKDS